MICFYSGTAAAAKEANEQDFRTYGLTLSGTSEPALQAVIQYMETACRSPQMPQFNTSVGRWQENREFIELVKAA